MYRSCGRMFGHSSRFAAVSKTAIFGAYIMTELVLCIGNAAYCRMENHPAIDVAHLLRNRGYFLEKHFGERKKSGRQAFRNTPSLAETDPHIAIPKARGLNPCLWPGRERRDSACDHPRPFLLSGA